VQVVLGSRFKFLGSEVRNVINVIKRWCQCSRVRYQKTKHRELSTDGRAIES